MKSDRNVSDESDVESDDIWIESALTDTSFQQIQSESDTVKTESDLDDDVTFGAGFQARKNCPNKPI
jgi:hypothetical protein